SRFSRQCCCFEDLPTLCRRLNCQSRIGRGGDVDLLSLECGGDTGRGDEWRGQATVGLLVVEEDVRSECLEDAGFWHAAHEEGLVDLDVPGPQSVEYSEMSRHAPRGHQRCPNRWSLKLGAILEDRKCTKQPPEWP